MDPFDRPTVFSLESPFFSKDMEPREMEEFVSLATKEYGFSLKEARDLYETLSENADRRQYDKILARAAQMQKARNEALTRRFQAHLKQPHATTSVRTEYDCSKCEVETSF